MLRPVAALLLEHNPTPSVALSVSQRLDSMVTGHCKGE